MVVSPSDEQAVKSAAGGNVECVAMVQLYESNNAGGWDPCNTTGYAAVVGVSGSYIIKIIDTSAGNSCDFAQEIYTGMVYDDNCSFFHHFEVDDTVVGLNFGDESEASSFGSTVKRHIPSADGGYDDGGYDDGGYEEGGYEEEGYGEEGYDEEGYDEGG
eukprot:CAMPEP_0119131948 /NCGR_PEP_ID=MMETSP1310-20130426/10983_1 /TAXON_ID=464262 /ORGANISM="Genus nov. species nov., Strain RCC2339" /LENGTH=158 /DNA_ID=CAMNT_0007122549 /DNA_START=79 /DNA_END=551 /DNA_ORIENTATION=-